MLAFRRVAKCWYCQETSVNVWGTSAVKSKWQSEIGSACLWYRPKKLRLTFSGSRFVVVKYLFSLAKEKYSHKNYLIRSRRIGLASGRGVWWQASMVWASVPEWDSFFPQLSRWEVLALTGKCADRCSGVVFALVLCPFAGVKSSSIKLTPGYKS